MRVLLKTISLIVFILCLSSLAFALETIGEKNLTTIKYCLEPFRTFEIVNTNVKNIKLEDLTGVLKKYKLDHPTAQFELFAEVKCVPEESNKIIAAIRKAGIRLIHYWAPISISDDFKKSGPYGPGFVDIIHAIK